MRDTSKNKRKISRGQNYRKGTAFVEYLNRRIDYIEETQKDSLYDLPLLHGIQPERNGADSRDENEIGSIEIDASDFLELLKTA